VVFLQKKDEMSLTDRFLLFSSPLGFTVAVLDRLGQLAPSKVSQKKKILQSIFYLWMRHETKACVLPGVYPGSRGRRGG